jgi:hypothetical protein
MNQTEDTTPPWVPPAEIGRHDGSFPAVDPYNEDPYYPDPYAKM